jgi:hypothetical protein
MVEPELIRAQRYHDRAQSLRRVAKEVDDPKASAKLKALAQEYDSISSRILRRRIKPGKSAQGG